MGTRVTEHTRNKTRKGVRKPFIALLIAGFLALVAGVGILAPKVEMRASAEKPEVTVGNVTFDGVESYTAFFTELSKKTFEGTNLQIYISESQVASLGGGYLEVGKTLFKESLQAYSKTKILCISYYKDTDTAENIIRSSVMGKQLTDVNKYFGAVFFGTKDVVLNLHSACMTVLGSGYTMFMLNGDDVTFVGDAAPDNSDYLSNLWTGSIPIPVGSSRFYQTVVKHGIALPEDPVKEGYIFKGWFLDVACTIPYNGELITEDMTFTAGWQIKVFRVSFSSGLGTPVETKMVDWNTAVSLTTPIREGYTFLGWFIGETQYTDGAIKEDTTLMAKWEIKVYTVTFMVDGAVYKTMQVEYGTSLTEAMKMASMSHFKVLNDSGERDGTKVNVTSNMSLVAAEMTKAERVGMFFGNNQWLLIMGASLIGALSLALIIAIAVAKNRG